MFRKFRKTSKVTKEEIAADFVFLGVSLIVSLIVLYLFDIHWNFYPGGHLFPPEKHIFTNNLIYVYGGLIGAIVGFFVIKLLLIGIKEEEVAWKKGDNLYFFAPQKG